MSISRPFGVYVHVPFCRFRCDYCAFATYTDRDHLMGDYAEACVTEIERAGSDGSLPPASSVFLGGGTPSRMPADSLVGILAAIPRRRGPRSRWSAIPRTPTPTGWPRTGTPG